MLNHNHKDYPLYLLKRECLKRGIDFIVECGVKKFLYNGDFFGLTTTKEWNRKIKTEKIIYQSKAHYFNEVLSYLKNGVECVLRHQDLARNPFLLSLAETEVCNGLAVYTRNNTGIVAYFFTARHDDKEAMNFFLNHLGIFKSIVNVVNKHLMERNYWAGNFIDFETKILFNSMERKIIFGDIKESDTYSRIVLVDGQKIQFSARQTQLLDSLKYHKTTKDIALDLNLETRTVEWHLSELRKKIGASNKKELVNFVETFC